MKKWLFMGAMALAFTSCSNDETVELNDASAISFRVTAQNNSRAAETYCANNLPQDFNVWALTADNKTLLNGVKFSKSEGGTYLADITRYWPEGDVQFLAFKNEGTASADLSATEGKLTGFTVADDVKSQVDLLYAFKKAQKPENGTLALNFRHALSQIEFKALNSNSALHVVVSGVRVVNVNSKGDYAISQVTDKNIVDHDFNGTDVTTRGTWSNLSDKSKYAVTFDAVTLGTSASSLTSATDASKAANNAMLLIPGKYDKWDPEASDNTGKTYFMLDCIIYNVAGGEFDAAKDVLLWGDDSEGAVTAKPIVIPVEIDWKEGKRYTYTFKFGTGGGGFTDPDDPKPVLVPISFTCTVDDFVDGGNTDVDL